MSRRKKVPPAAGSAATASTPGAYSRVATRRVLSVEDRRRLASFYFLLMTVDRRVQAKKSSSGRSKKVGQKCVDITLTRIVLHYLATKDLLDESMAVA